MAHPTSRSETPPSRWSALLDRLGTVGELLRLLSATRYYWLTPMVVVLAGLGLVLAGMQSVPVVAPFLYALF